MTTTDEAVSNAPGRFRSIRNSTWKDRISERIAFKLQSCKMNSVAVVTKQSGRETCQIYLGEEMQLDV